MTLHLRMDGDTVSTAAEEAGGDAGAARPTSAPSTGRETTAAPEGGNSFVAHRQFYPNFLLSAGTIFGDIPIRSIVPYRNIKYENQ